MGEFLCPGCNEVVVRSLQKGKKYRSCSCLKRNQNGESNTRLFRIWTAMKRRCNNSNAKHYHCYGGRGISVCDEWENSFTNFKEWSLKNGYSDDLQIDRCDNDGNYNPENCRFVTHSKNNLNKSNTKLNWVKVDAMRDLRKSGVKLDTLVSLFGVGRTMVSRITLNQAWIYGK